MIQINEHENENDNEMIFEDEGKQMDGQQEDSFEDNMEKDLNIKKKIKKYNSKKLNFASKEKILQKIRGLESMTGKFANTMNIKESAKNLRFMNSLKTMNKKKTPERKRNDFYTCVKNLLTFFCSKCHRIEAAEETSKSLFKMDDVIYLIYPDSPFKKFWNSLISVLLMYTAIILPYTICFLDNAGNTLRSLELFIDIIFMIDIPLNFISAYYSETGLIVDEMSMIISKYFRTWFFVDLVSSFPIQLVIASEDEENSSMMSTARFATFRVYKLLRLLRMIKMVRVLKYGKMINYLFLKMKINIAIGKIIFIFFSIYLTVHIISCLWVFIVRVNDTQWSWISDRRLDDMDNLTIYIASLYWAFATIFTVGFGDVHPVNNLEKIFCIIWMIFGAGFYSYTIGNLLTIIQNFDKKESLISDKVERIEELTSKIQLNTPLSFKIKSYFQHKFSENFIYDQDNIIDELSQDLIFKIIQTVFSPALVMFDIFHNDPPIQFVNSFILHLKALYLDDKHYYIYKFGERAEEVYFMIFGKISMYDEEENECLTYGAGTYYGEVEVLFDEPRLFSVKTMKVCEILFISRQNYLKILREYNKIFEMEIYKAYKRRHFYMTRILYYRNKKLAKMGKVNNDPTNTAYVDIDDSLNLYGKNKREDDRELQKMYSRKEFRIASKKHLDFRNPADIMNLDKNKEVQQILNKIDTKNFNIDMKGLEMIKNELTQFGKEYTKHFKKIKKNVSSSINIYNFN